MKKIKDFTKYTASGEMLDFADQVSCPEDINVGMTATISDPLDGTLGSIPNGDYTMPNGDLWTFVKGTLTEMKEYEGEEPLEIGAAATVKAIRIKGEIYHWLPERKRFMRVCTGIRLGGKLYVPGANGKFNTLAKDQTIPAPRFSKLKPILAKDRNPGKPILGI